MKLSLVGAVVSICMAGQVLAQDIVCDDASDHACRFDIPGANLQKVPAVLKFQARVSQAKLPRGDGAFGTVLVRLLRNTTILCTEQFRNIIVKDGMLNLEIGRKMDCELDEVIAENRDLAFQVCLGGPENCLRPIPLGSASYASKASFAAVAQESHHANIAARAHYAHRATADRDMFIRNVVGAGFFDFATPTPARAASVFTSETFPRVRNGGFIAWTATGDALARNLHVVGRRHDTGQLTVLDRVHFATDVVHARGDVTVRAAADSAGMQVTGGGARITGDSDVSGRLRVDNDLDVASGGIHVTGDSEVSGELIIGNGLAVHSGGLDATGDSSVAGTLGITEMLEVLSGGVAMTGGLDLAGALLVHGGTSGVLQVGGAGTIEGSLAARGGLLVQTGGANIASGGLTIAAGGLTATGASSITGGISADAILVSGALRAHAGSDSFRVIAIQGATLAVNPDASFPETLFQGPVTFDGPVIFEGGTIDPRQAENFVLASGETRDLAFSDTLTVVGRLALTGGLVGGLDVDGGLSVGGAVELTGGIVGGLDVAGNLAVGGLSTFNGPTALPGGLRGDLALAGTLSTTGDLVAPGGVSAGGSLTISGGGSFAQGLAVAGSSTFSGPITFGGGIQGNVVFANTIATAGRLSALNGLTLQGGLTVAGASVFDNPVTFVGGLNSGVSFADNFSVAGTSVFLNSVAIGGNLTIDGTTRFNGPVNFSGAFTGTTSFENLTAAGTLTVGGMTTFSGPVNFLGTVNGLNNLSAYVKASGDTRNITLGGLVVTGNLTVNGNFQFPAAIENMVTTTMNVTENVTGENNVDINNNLVTNRFEASRCRICINYSDNYAQDVADYKHVCVAFVAGSSSGIINLAGNVNADDTFALKFICDGGGASSGAGWR